MKLISVTLQIPVISKSMPIFQIHNLGRLYEAKSNINLEKVTLPKFAVMSDQIRPIDATKCLFYDRLNTNICSEGI